MYYGEIKKTDIANGEGVRVTLFVSGCRNHCKNCFNPETWCFTYGKPFTSETEEMIFEALSPSYIKGLTLLGGDPFEPENQRDLLPFLIKVREKFPEKTIWAYSGYTMDKELLGNSRVHTEHTKKILELIDILVDGRFVEELKNLMLNFRGSSNQRIIDVKRSLETGKIVLSPLNNTREEICENLN